MHQRTLLILLQTFTVFQIISGQVYYEVRLADSGIRCSGRVEILIDGQWGTVCDDLWDLDDAQVVCRQLGCGNATLASARAEYGMGFGPIWLDDVQCSGNELSITDCRHQGLGTHNCFHGEDASVRCEGDSSNTTSATPLQRLPVRLAGTDSQCSGRVEVFNEGQWGTVCDDLWDLQDAHVVCQQLGCGHATSSPRSAAFGQGSGPIWLDDVQCDGNESSITECRHRGIGLHNCGHGEDASVTCDGEIGNSSTGPSLHVSSPVRLANSDVSGCFGRVEVFLNGVWGTVCDDFWDMTDANVVCQQLGCGNATSAPHNAAFGEGRGSIWLDNVQCYGNESSIAECRHSGVGSHDCGHGEDASVTCEGVMDNNTSSSPVRLAGSGSNCSGRVEVFFYNQWGTVCDDTWDMNDAAVVCQQLGCGNAISAPHSARFGRGSGQIWLDNVQCSGNESSITDCSHSGIGSHNCGHGEDASVICEGNIVNLPRQNTLSSPMSLRLVDSKCSGRLEVYYQGVWGAVCGDHWDMNDAHVVCQQLGCGRVLAHSPLFSEVTGPISMYDVECLGNESSIAECTLSGFGSSNCTHLLNITCEGYLPYFPNTTLIPQVKLAGSSSRCSGRVEVFVNGEWGTVCDDSWDIVDANVVCQQLGCGNATSAPVAASFGSGTGRIWFDEIQCYGDELSITHCSHAGVGSHDCDHWEDASVICEEDRFEAHLGTSSTTQQTQQTTRATAPTQGGAPAPSGDTWRYNTTAHSPVRLVGSGSRCSGRVEVFLNGQWGTVCDDSWDTSDAGVVCRQVGCGYPTAAPLRARFGQGTGPIWLDNVYCSGNESSITDCSHSGIGSHNCDHEEDASVICEDESVSTSSMDLPVRVVNSGNNCSGLVEVFIDGFWGSVCDTSWDINDVQVVCRQLGCGRALRALNSSLYSVSRGSRVLSHVQCSGNESSITECPHRKLYRSPYCSNAGVICKDNQSIMQATRISCSRYTLQVGIPLVSLLSAGLNTSSGHLADPSCRYYSISYYTMWYRVSRRAGSCGNIWMPNSTHVIYFNSLYFYPENANSSTQPEVIPFSCAYPLEATADVLAAMPETLPNSVSALGPKPSAYMTLYRDSMFDQTYPFGMVTLPPGSSLYVGVSVHQMERNWVVVLEDCYVTHTPQHDGPVHYYLIRNKCPLDPMRVSVLPIGLSGRAYFSARPFPTLDSNPYIFLHCRVTLCDDSVNTCIPSCRRRTRRSVSSKAQLIPLTLGPITWAK